MAEGLGLIVKNPSNGQTLKKVPCDGNDAALQKIDRAYQCYHDAERRLPLHVRIAYLEKLIDYIKAKEKEFITTMVEEGGKPWKDSVVEFNRAIAGIKLSIHAVSEHQGKVIPLGYQQSSSGRKASTQAFPIGVVLAFSAFNHPLNLIVHQIIPAFAAGCPCIVKPAADTPLSCIALVDAMHAVGIPEEYIQVVIAADHSVSGAMVESEKISFFSFIGSAKVGWMLRSKLKPGVRCALEHGGVAPCIVSKSADLDHAVTAITKGAFYHAGQVCVSTQRVYVDASVYDEFVSKLADSAKALKMGEAIDPDVDVGPLIRSSEVERIDAWVSEALAQGAECRVGGHPVGEHYYAPTILCNAPSDSKVNQQEIFGPVVSVASYSDFDDALKSANHELFAFQAALFSNDANEINKAYDIIEASALMINDHTAFRDDVMPFAGLKASGLGVGGIPYTVEEMQFQKMLVQNNG